MPDDQLSAAVAVIRGTVPSDVLRGVYLFGSAVSGGLRPDSDLDLLVVATRRLEPGEQRAIVAGLLPISGRATRQPAWRPLDVTVVAEPDVRPWRYPPWRDLQYGEWLREAFLDGSAFPSGGFEPDVAVLLTMARATGVALVGPPPAEVLDPVPLADLRRAMVDTLPALLQDLRSDTRNVLLTLARAWCTAVTGEIRSKDEAAAWAIERLPEAHRALLAKARSLYLEGGWGPWRDVNAVDAVARFMTDDIRET